MKNNHLLSLCAFLMLFVAQVSAQSSLDKFSQLESQGTFPADFKKVLMEDKDMADYNVFLRELVMDGNILYGTKLNDYVNTIVDNLLKDDLALRSKIHVYIMRSASVNAFSTDNGLLIVNIGLLAQVSNESELAFVLAHEIAHYAERHVSKINDYRDTLKDRNAILHYLKYQNRSREHEMAADRLALERFYSKTSYSYEAVDGVFDVLLYSDLPFDEVPFTNNLMETDFYQFPNNYFLANVNPISSRADNLDTLLTHPNIERRRGALQPRLANKSNAGRAVFVQSEELFNEVRKLARFECLNIFLTEHHYDKALYNAYVLKRQHPDNAFLDEVVVTALYGFSKHKNYSKIGDVIQPYKSVEGEMQQTSHFLSKLNRQESSLLAFRFAWAAKEKYPEKRYFEEVAKDALKDIVVKNKMKYNDFSDYPMGTIPDSIELEEKPTVDTSTKKYSRIKNQKAAAKVIPTAKFKTMNFMLVDIHQMPEFVAMMNDVKNTADDEAILDAVSTKRPSDVKRMIVAEPQYVVKTMKHNRLIFNQKRSEQGSKRLAKTVKTCLKRLHVESVSYTKRMFVPSVRSNTTVMRNCSIGFMNMLKQEGCR